MPVVASGGVGTLEHLVEGVTEGHASAVLAASIFHFGTHTIAEAHAALRAAGFPRAADRPAAGRRNLRRCTGSAGALRDRSCGFAIPLLLLARRHPGAGREHGDARASSLTLFGLGVLGVIVGRHGARRRRD